MKIKFVKNFIFLLYLCVFTGASIPDYIKVCHRSDPEISRCILNSVDVLRPKLQTGIPELNVPSLEPLLINTLSLRRGPNNALINLNITNLKVWGPSKFIVQSTNHDINKIKFDFKLLLPKINFKGLYTIDMHILSIKIKGRGTIIGTMANLQADVKMQGRFVQAKTSNNTQQQHIKFDPLKIRLKIGNSSLRLNGLFAENPVLSRVANDVVKENSGYFIEEIRPALETAMSDVFTNAANQITSRFTYAELFPK